MNPVWKIALKDLRLILRDKLSLFFMFVFPILMGIIFGMIGGQMNSGESNAIRVALVDHDDSDNSRSLVTALQANENMELEILPEEEARNLVRRGRQAALIVIPAGYGESAGAFWEPDPPEIVIVRDPSRTAESAMVQGYLLEAAGQLMGKRFQDPASFRPQVKDWIADLDQSDASPLTRGALTTMFQSMDQFFADLDTVQQSAEAGDDEAAGYGFQLAKIRVESVAAEKSATAQLVEKIRSPWDISFPAAMMWGVLATSSGFAISLVRERTTGTLVRLQTAPIARWQILGGKALACFMAVVFVVTAMIVLALILGMRPGNYPFLLLACLAIAICFVGIMLTISTLGGNEQSVAGAGWGANVTMAMFGGGMIPLAFMPDFFAGVSNFSPVKWAIISLEGAIWRDFSFAELLTPLLVLLMIGAVGAALGIALLRRQTD